MIIMIIMIMLPAIGIDIVLGECDVGCSAVLQIELLNLGVQFQQEEGFITFDTTLYYEGYQGL